MMSSNVMMTVIVNENICVILILWSTQQDDAGCHRHVLAHVIRKVEGEGLFTYNKRFYQRC